MAVMKSEQNLHEIIPDCVLGDWSIELDCLVYDGSKIATATVLHNDVQNASFAVDVTVVVAYDVIMMEVLENVHFSDNLLAISLGHAFKVEFFTRKYL